MQSASATMPEVRPGAGQDPVTTQKEGCLMASKGSFRHPPPPSKKSQEREDVPAHGSVLLCCWILWPVHLH